MRKWYKKMDLAGLGIQKEIPIYRQEISRESDVLMLSEDVRWQDCLNRAWYMLRFDTSALSLENIHHGSIDSGSPAEIINLQIIVTKEIIGD